jgi:segregation and condensation protein A
MPLQDDYRVTIDAFQGPLDLLLYLIRRVEVDITEIPVHEITDQYLAFLRHIDVVDVDLAGEFLVMAATLIELKSRTIMPPEAAPGDGAGQSSATEPTDPRYELVQQLLAYQRFRTVADALDERRRTFADRYPGRPARRPAEMDDVSDEDDADAPAIELEDVHVMDLADAYGRIMSSIDFARLGDHVVEIDDTPIALHQEDLLDRLRHATEGGMCLQDAFGGQPAGQRVGMFLAVLELVRTRRITVQQDDLDGAIEMRLLDEAEQSSV